MRFINVLLIVAVSCFLNLTTACDSGSNENGNDVISENDTTEPDTMDEDAYGDTSLEMIENDESEADADIDTGDPLEEYYCIEGTWKRISIDGKLDNTLSDVSILEWDKEKGAGAGPFLPLGGIWFKKNQQTLEFELFVEIVSGNWAEGIMNSDCNHLEFDFHNIDAGITAHIIFKKL